MMIRRWVQYLLLVFILFSFSYAVYSEPLKETEPGIESFYVISPGDELDISVWGQPDLSKLAKVDENGKIIFPLLGEMQVAGLTIQELRNKLTEDLDRDYLVSPYVSVKMLNQAFSILGEVEQPGSYPITSQLDILTAISLAGGFNKFASHSVEIIRKVPGGKDKIIQINIDRVLGRAQENILIQPKDVINVKRRFF